MTFVGLPITVNLSGGSNLAPVISSVTVTPDPVTGTQAACAVLATDDQGEAGLTYTWSVVTSPTDGTATFSANATNAAKAAMATFTRAGSYVICITATDATALATVQDATITVNQTPTTVAVAPTPVTLASGATQAFTSQVRDQFAIALATQPTPTWSLGAGSVGSISIVGVYTAAGTGSATVRATVGSLSGSAAVTITGSGNTAPVITAATASPTPLTGTHATLTATATDTGGEAGLTYTWSVQAMPAGGGAATFSINGTNAAKSSVVTVNRAGAWTFRVTASDGSLVDTEDVVLQVNQTLTGLRVSPSTVSLLSRATRAFTAENADQFGNAMGSASSVVWTVASGSSGTIDASGLYTAGSVGAATIQAASGTLTGTSTVTVTTGMEQERLSDESNERSCGVGSLAVFVLAFAVCWLRLGRRYV